MSRVTAGFLIIDTNGNVVSGKETGYLRDFLTKPQADKMRPYLSKSLKITEIRNQVRKVLEEAGLITDFNLIDKGSYYEPQILSPDWIFSIPKGGAESYDDDIEATARRELLEEAGITIPSRVNPIKIDISPSMTVYFVFVKPENKHLVTALIRRKNSEKASELMKIGWYPISEVLARTNMFTREAISKARTLGLF